MEIIFKFSTAISVSIIGLTGWATWDFFSRDSLISTPKLMVFMILIISAGVAGSILLIRFCKKFDPKKKDYRSMMTKWIGKGLRVAVADAVVHNPWLTSLLPVNEVLSLVESIAEHFKEAMLEDAGPLMLEVLAELNAKSEREFLNLFRYYRRREGLRDEDNGEHGRGCDDGIERYRVDPIFSTMLIQLVVFEHLTAKKAIIQTTRFFSKAVQMKLERSVKRKERMLHYAYPLILIWRLICFCWMGFWKRFTFIILFLVAMRRMSKLFSKQCPFRYEPKVLEF